VQRLVPLALVLLGALLVAAALWVTGLAREAAGWLATGGASAFATLGVLRYLAFRTESAASGFGRLLAAPVAARVANGVPDGLVDELFPDPGYTARAGFLHLVEADVAWSRSCVSSGRPIGSAGGSSTRSSSCRSAFRRWTGTATFPRYLRALLDLPPEAPDGPPAPRPIRPPESPMSVPRSLRRSSFDTCPAPWAPVPHAVPAPQLIDQAEAMIRGHAPTAEPLPEITRRVERALLAPHGHPRTGDPR
jgi:hypothetical protein